MFFDVTKYDVITLEESRLGMDFIRLSSRLVALSNALGKENVDDDMILDKPVTELNPDNFKLMHKMTKPDFSVTELTQSEIDRLNRYHEEYMKERIYSRVTDKSLDDEDILSHAKKIGAKRNGTF